MMNRKLPPLGLHCAASISFSSFFHYLANCYLLSIATYTMHISHFSPHYEL
ncbi:hypothetical protein BDN72DRAFT_835023, partial [Pluteus cervinus]